MVTVSNLLNPGMSKMLSGRSKGGKKRSQCGTLGAVPELRPLLGPWGSLIFYSGGDSESRKGQGGEPGSSEPLESRQLKAPGFA